MIDEEDNILPNLDDSDDSRHSLDSNHSLGNIDFLDLDNVDIYPELAEPESLTEAEFHNRDMRRDTDMRDQCNPVRESHNDDITHETVKMRIVRYLFSTLPFCSEVDIMME